MPFAFKTRKHTRLADTDTPISMYLKIRDLFPCSILLESAESDNQEHYYSYICCNPIAGIIVANEQISKQYPDGSLQTISISNTTDIVQEVTTFMQEFSVQDKQAYNTAGVFGYISYDAVRYFDTVDISTGKQIPDIQFHFYKNVFVFDHFRKELCIIEHILDENEPGNIEQLLIAINNKHIPAYPFTITGEEKANCTDEDFLNIIAKGKEHCYRGDVFQIVLSREFSTPYNGDDFNVYRSLRSINPSPYLFYFDYGNFRLMGSSPEAQLKIKDGIASIHPIAGTYRRTGDQAQDNLLAQQLKEDKKENAEHVMLVDLARNDLSKSYKQVDVAVYKEIQFFSHVIHMVSKVTGAQHIADNNTFQTVADTFPAGTLSGAPKHRAMQLIDLYETTGRGFYGGCIGYMGFDGVFNQAIMIRSFLSKDNTLYYRAGAGVVAASVDATELQEVNNKLAALRKALTHANTFQK